MIFVYQFGDYKYQYQYSSTEKEDDNNNYVNPEWMFTQMRFVEYKYECFDRLM